MLSTEVDRLQREEITYKSTRTCLWLRVSLMTSSTSRRLSKVHSGFGRRSSMGEGKLKSFQKLLILGTAPRPENFGALRVQRSANEEKTALLGRSVHALRKTRRRVNSAPSKRRLRQLSFRAGLPTSREKIGPRSSQFPGMSPLQFRICRNFVHSASCEHADDQ